MAEKRESGKLWTALHAMLRSPNASLAREPISSSLLPTGKNISLCGCLLLLKQKAENKTCNYVTLGYGAIRAKPVSIMHLSRVGSGKLGTEVPAEVWGVDDTLPMSNIKDSPWKLTSPITYGLPQF